MSSETIYHTQPETLFHCWVDLPTHTFLNQFIIYYKKSYIYYILIYWWIYIFVRNTNFVRKYIVIPSALF